MFRKVMFFLVLTMFLAINAFANDGAASADVTSLKSFGIAIALGMATLGGALGQGRAVASALDGIARNPAAADKLFVPMILGLVFIESLAIYALIIAFLKM